MPDLFLDAEQQSVLTSRIVAGDRAAEDELVSHFSGRVFALLVARTRDRETARDLLQETMLATIATVREGRLNDPSRLAAFILATARNQASGHIRTLAQRPHHMPLPGAGIAAAATDFAEENQRDALTRQAILRLDDTDRTILLRTLVEGEKPGIIARVLGLTSEVVRQRKTRAVKKVAEYVRMASQSARPDDHSGRSIK
jgi:RNA polymerase sigma-70 factor (ECF subfamily)